MNSFQENQRQLRIALIGIIFILLVGVVGFMLFEGLSLLDSLWLTIITLATVGYGDIFAQSEAGRIFTIFLVLTGLSLFAFGLQASATFFLSPGIRELRQKRRIQRMIDGMSNHYILCGVGEMVDKTIDHLIQRAATRRSYEQEHIYEPLDHLLDRIFGDDAHGHYVRPRKLLRSVFLSVMRLFRREKTMLDVIVVITTDAAYAETLRNAGLLVIEGQPTEDSILERAGIKRAQAMMVMLDDDTESLFVTLTARSHNPDIYITAATLEEDLAQKMIRVGANSVIAPFDVASNFLNNATLRPAVNAFFNSILFDHSRNSNLLQLYILKNSPWAGQTLADLRFHSQYHSAVLGLRLNNGHFLYAPPNDHRLLENEVLLVAAPHHTVQALETACYENTARHTRSFDLGRLSMPPAPVQTSDQLYTLEEAADAVQKMSKHFVICGTGRIIRNAVNKLNPARPFVVVCDDESYTAELLERGFRVIQGNPTNEKTLLRAGVDRAQAIMVNIENKADAVLTILISRALSRHLLITATANTDDMIPKLHRAGADRVVSPFHIAAQFVLLATTAPVVNDFLLYVLFNYQVGLETTELYTEEDSPWIDQTIGDLHLGDQYNAGVLGIQKADGSYLYAPPPEYRIGKKEVLIVTTPMSNSDELRNIAHGSETKRPRTLRQREVPRSGILSRSALDEILRSETSE